jgi:thymidylate synthase
MTSEFSIRAESVADAVRQTIGYVSQNGSSVRRKVGRWAMQKTEGYVVMHEVHGLQIQVTNPLRRWHNYVSKGVLAETIDLLTGGNPGVVHKYYKFYRRWLSRGGTYPYTYGSRIHGLNEQVDQWSQCVKILRGDITSRHAILLIRRPWDLIEDYQPCSVFAQFQLSGSSNLDMMWVTRSQDVDVGGLARNLFMESHILEQMCEEVGIGMGNIYHYATNIHIYSTQFQKTLDLMETIKEAPSCTPAGLLSVEDRSYLMELDESGISNPYFRDWILYLKGRKRDEIKLGELVWLMLGEKPKTQLAEAV